MGELPIIRFEHLAGSDLHQGVSLIADFTRQIHLWKSTRSHIVFSNVNMYWGAENFECDQAEFDFRPMASHDPSPKAIIGKDVSKSQHMGFSKVNIQFFQM